MIKRFFRHIKEGTSSVARNGAMSIASASAVTITLLLVSVFIILAVNVKQVTDSVEYQLTIHVKLDNAVVSQVEIDSIGNQIKNIDGVRTVEFSSKENELQKFIDSDSFYSRYEGENNPLRNAYVVTTTSGDVMQSVSDQIGNIVGVEQSYFGGEGVTMLVNALNAIQQVGFILVIVLSLLAVFLISNTIKVTIYARKDEISLMRTVGATNGFIRAPFLVEGVAIGLLGAAIPIIVSVVGYYFLYVESNGQLFAKMFPLQPIMPFVLYLSLILAAAGMVVGFIGSFISVTKYLRWKR